MHYWDVQTWISKAQTHWTHFIDSLELQIWKMMESAVGKLIWNKKEWVFTYSRVIALENISLSPHVRQNRVLALKIKLSWSECSIIWYAAVCEAALNYNPFSSGPPIIQVCVCVRVCTRDRIRLSLLASRILYASAYKHTSVCIGKHLFQSRMAFWLAGGGRVCIFMSRKPFVGWWKLTEGPAG